MVNLSKKTKDLWNYNNDGFWILGQKSIEDMHIILIPGHINIDSCIEVLDNQSIVSQCKFFIEDKNNQKKNDGWIDLLYKYLRKCYMENKDNKYCPIVYQLSARNDERDIPSTSNIPS